MTSLEADRLDGQVQANTFTQNLTLKAVVIVEVWQSDL